ncbi:cGMP-dependent protein kinase, isozyme 2 forms cD4/T1/T3A/T3B [Halotydeus destructor]|nr:cGMP-dependent protein kinase, isozyme 2 forms cD4/T1/T3A/T3B [Halotydeus destructor]
MYGSSWFYSSSSASNQVTPSSSNFDQPVPAAFSLPRLSQSASSVPQQQDDRRKGAAAHFHPTIQDQVALCRKIAAQLVDDQNARSKGADMFFRRVRRAPSWEVAQQPSAAKQHENGGAAEEGEQEEVQDWSDEALRLRLRQSLFSHEEALEGGGGGGGGGGVSRLMDPRGRLQSYESAKLQGGPGGQLLQPTGSTSSTGGSDPSKSKAAQLFLARKEKSQQWEEVAEERRRRHSAIASSTSPPPPLPAPLPEPLVAPKVVFSCSFKLSRSATSASCSPVARPQERPVAAAAAEPFKLQQPQYNFLSESVSSLVRKPLYRAPTSWATHISLKPAAGGGGGGASSLLKQHQQKRTTRLVGISAEPRQSELIVDAQADPPHLTAKDDRVHELVSRAFGSNDFLKQVLQQDDEPEVEREMAEACTLQTFAPGAVVVQQGEPGHVLYIVESGVLEVTTGSGALRQLRRGDLFGELALLYNCTRTASVAVLAAEPAQLWALQRSAFQWLMVQSGLRRRAQLLSFLQRVPLFRDRGEQVLNKLADACERRTYARGDYIVRQGARGDTFFVLAKGSVQVTENQPAAAEGTTEEKAVRRLEPGDYFGEKALVGSVVESGAAAADGLRTANVVSLEDGVQCLVLDRDSFQQLVGPQLQLQQQQQEVGEEAAPGGAEQYDWLTLEQLERVKTLGIGGFGRVDLVTVRGRPAGGPSFALKVMLKKQIVETRQQQHILSEKQVMLKCADSEFVVRLWRTFKDSLKLYLLMESCLGGELWTLLRDRGHFDEPSARFYSGCVCVAFDFLHARNIVYRDLKPENMLLDGRGYVKLTDFGFAKQLQGNGRKTWTFCGTPEYVAPEIILNRGHDLAADFWSLGVLLFELLTGSPPFTGPDPMHTYNVILKGMEAIDFPKLISRNAAALIRRLCRENPAERLGYATGNGIDDVKAHRWYDGFDWAGIAARRSPAPYVPSISSSTDASNFDEYPEPSSSANSSDQQQQQSSSAFVTDLGGWDDDF